MTKRILLIISVLFYTTIKSQSKNLVGNYYGHYSNDNVIIDISFDIRADNTYTIIQKHIFRNSYGCHSDTIIQNGKWICKQSWIYFKPDKKLLESDWKILPPYTDLVKHPKNERKLIVKMIHVQGYEFYLKPVIINKKNTQIWFHILDDCFEQYWFYQCVEKQE